MENIIDFISGFILGVFWFSILAAIIVFIVVHEPSLIAIAIFAFVMTECTTRVANKMGAGDE